MLDLDPIKARLAATTPGEWRWQDEFGREIPYDDTTWIDNGRRPIHTGNDGSLGVSGVYVEEVISEDEAIGHAVFYADDEDIPADPDDPDDVDWNNWRGLIRVSNIADLEFIAQAKSDMATLIAEVERLHQQGAT